MTDKTLSSWKSFRLVESKISVAKLKSVFNPLDQRLSASYSSIYIQHYIFPTTYFKSTIYPSQ
jgi:hypothetical protein